MSTTNPLDFRSDALLNLHHVLYAEAWAAEAAATDRRPAAQLIDRPLELRGSDGYADAVDYYRRELIDRDLLFDASMRELSAAVTGLGGATPPAGTVWSTHS